MLTMKPIVDPVSSGSQSGLVAVEVKVIKATGNFEADVNAIVSVIFVEKAR